MGRTRVAKLVILLALAALTGTAQAATAPAWSVPNVDALPNDGYSQLIRDGRALTVETYSRIGPEVADPAKRYAGNNLSCQNCHLEAGTKQFGLPYVGVYPDFPQYRAREGHVGTLEERINGCMTRSMNGRPLPDDSPEMRAIVAYIQFLSTGPKQEGRGSSKLPELKRAADPVRGRVIYAQACAACHGPDGQGKKRDQKAAGYELPPLWGHDSFNDGAGMNRLISAASFIHANMPNGVTWQAPALSEDNAWDVAAFVISQRRPHKAALDQDYPKRLEKPVDAAYPPFADGFSADQHRFGPFEPIRAQMKSPN